MRRATGIVLSAALLSLLAGCEKARLDDEVRRLCAIDGGIRVYETVKLPAERFDKLGALRIPSKETAKLEDEYFYVWRLEYIKKGNPSLVRSKTEIIRRSDGKVLGESVRYGRGGGDLPSPMHDSSFVCPPISADEPSLEARIFQRE